MSATYTISIFTDIRNSTGWQRSSYESQRLSPYLLEDFDEALYRIFLGARIRFLGDGFFVSVPIHNPEDDLERAQVMVLNRISELICKFSTLCEGHSVIDPECNGLKLGWGVASGVVETIKLTQDYALIGPSIVIAQRCCDIARPFGVVVDGKSFEAVNEKLTLLGYRYMDVELKGIGPWGTWKWQTE